jgi:hypothetical protein
MFFCPTRPNRFGNGLADATGDALIRVTCGAFPGERATMHMRCLRSAECICTSNYIVTSKYLEIQLKRILEYKLQAILKRKYTLYQKSNYKSTNHTETEVENIKYAT